MSIIKSLMPIFFGILMYGCKPKNEIKPILDAYKITQDKSSQSPHKKYDTIEYNKDLKVFIEYFNKGGVKEINNSLLGQKFGHSFVFDKNSHLDKYYFLIDSATAKIIIEKRGAKFFEKSKILMDYWPYAQSDKKKYSLIFSMFPRKNIHVALSYDGIYYKSVPLYESKLMPLLLEGDIIPDVKKVFIKVEASDLVLKLKDLQQIKNEADTLYFE